MVTKLELLVLLFSSFSLSAALFAALCVETVSGFDYTSAFDSGWIDVADKIGQNLTLYHNLSDANLLVDTTGRTEEDGAIHQIHLEVTNHESWSRTYGGAKNDEARSLIQTNDGGYAMSGHTWSAAGGYDFMFVKANHDGNIELSKTYGSDGTEYGGDAIQTTDGGYALTGNAWSSRTAGNFDFWLIKTDSGGNIEWSRTYGGGDDDTARGIAQTSDGGYALAGYTRSYGAGEYDFWLVKTDSQGNVEWNKTYGGANDDVPWFDCLVRTSDGGYAIAGYTHSFGEGNGDFWLVKTDSAGNIEWNGTYGGKDNDGAASVIQTRDEGYAIAGSTMSFGEGDWDFWLVKTDSAGNMEWNRTYGGRNRDEANSVIQTVEGGFALAGFTESFGAGGGDFWLVKTDVSGNMQWNKTYGGTEGDFAWSVIQTENEGYVLTGHTASFSAGDVDFWLVKVTAEGVLATIDIDRPIDPYSWLTWILIGAVLIPTGIIAFFVAKSLNERRRNESQALAEEEVRLKAERQLAAERTQQRMKMEEEQRRVAMKQNADNFMKAGRYEDAAKLYEQFEMWDDAGECRRLARTTYVVSADVHVGKDGISANCPHCGSSERLTSKVSEVACRHCGRTYYIPKKILDMI